MDKEYEFLKKCIWENWFESLAGDPFLVYEKMIKDGVSERSARIVLVTLMSGVHEKARNGEPASDVTAYIQKEHSLMKRGCG